MFYFYAGRLIRCFVALVVLMSVPAFGLTLHDRTGEDVTFEWINSDARVQWFEVRLRWIDLNITPALVTEITKIDKGVFTATLKRPRLGHWAVEVRSCAMFKWDCTTSTLVADTAGTIQQCSDWQKSDVIGKPEPWAVYWKPAPVTGINIYDYIP